MPDTTHENNPRHTSQRSTRAIVAVAAVAAIAIGSVLVSLVVAEVGFRLANGISLADTSNFRLAGVRTKRIGDRAELDPLLGWTLKSEFRSEGFNTIGLGIRRNFDETEVRKGSILAVGDSFTEGFDEVDDDGTWPAHLEKIMGVPVVNAGVAGYAGDQILLRTEQLLPIIEPKTLIIGFTEADIYRAALSDSGAPKPYFMIENGELKYYPPGPVELKTPETAVGAAARTVLGYSALSDHLFSRLAPGFWYPHTAATYQEVENQPLDVICRLLDKTKRLADTRNVRTLVFLQYAGLLVLEEPDIIEDMKKLTACAQQAGIQVVDQFASLKQLTQNNEDLVAEYYTPDGQEFGHMTSKGNLHAAQLLAEALKAAPVAVDGASGNAALEAGKPLQN
jgi:lysophospholipase L1-like esterase